MKKKKKKKEIFFSGWSFAKGPFPSRFVVPMRKGGLLFKEALVEDPLEEMMAGMVMAQYGIVCNLPGSGQLHFAVHYYHSTPSRHVMA